ncbi:MAG TPA: asparagine synthase (glutamine-hydrolyzing) [Pseudomonadales bacterium]
MCGIAGILKFNSQDNIDESRLLAMRDSVWHRGPDEGGLIIDGRAGLAHRRLSIIDLASGQQPMSNAQRTVWISYNGEVYNFRELRTRLEALGARFSTRSDTEVVLRAYEYYGEDCVEHLQGMFAFAIWDAPKQRLFLARDRLGIKPLYYMISDTQLLFGSEIKAILAEGSVKPEFNRAVLPEFLASRYVTGSETFFKGVNKLLPGHTLSWTASTGFRKRRYWNLSAAPQGPELSRADYVDMVRSSLKDAVQSHMIADVPCGLFLSGGLDSSILASLMTQVSSEPVHSFSVAFSEAHANELEYARMAAQHAGTQHHEVMVSPEEFFSALPHLVWHEDEPVAWTSSVPLHAVSCLARKHVKVVLTGEGSDELFLGYDYRYRVTHWNKRLGAMYEKLPRAMRSGVSGAIGALPGSARRYAERTFLALDTDPRHMFFENFSVFRHDLRNAMLRPEHGFTDNPYVNALKHYHAAGDNTLQCMSHADLQTFLVELLMKQDQMSMAASIESRVPFLDHRLVEQVATIPSHEKLRFWQTKALLRDAVKDLVPRAILERKKMGFPVPTSDWLRGKYWPVVEEFVLGGRALERGHFNADVVQRLAQDHRSGRADNGERLWLLINLEMWQRIFLDGEKPADLYPRQKPVLSEFASEFPQPALALH